MRRLVLLIPLLLAACDGPPPTPVKADAPAAQRQVTLTPLGSFAAGVPTRLLVTDAGGRFIAQSTGDGTDAVYALLDDQLPRPTALSARAISDALALPAETRGEIQGLAPLPGGTLAWFFVGTAGPRTTAALGVFDPRSGEIRVRVTNDDLARVSGLGGTFALAHGTLLTTDDPGGGRVILWLNSISRSSVLSVEANRLAGEGAIVLTRPFAEMTLDDVPLRPGPDALLTAGPGGTLSLTAPSSSTVYQIDRDGRATLSALYVGLPPLSAAPVFEDAAAPWVFFPDDEPLPTREPPARTALTRTPFPALARPAKPDDIPFGRDDFAAPPGFPVHALRWTTIVRDKAGWLAYDDTSGVAMRVTINE